MAEADDIIVVMHLLNRYGVAVDSKRWDFFDRIFTADVVADYGGPVVYQGLDGFKRCAAEAWGPFDMSRHSMSNIVFDRDGSTGRSVTYGDWYIVRRGIEGGDLWEGKGWYHDEWALTQSGWRIRHRCCRVMQWSGNPLVPDATFKPGMAMATGPQTYALAEAADSGLFSFFKGT